MSIGSVVPRRVLHLALALFARLPGPVRRVLVRAGTPGHTVGAVCALEHGGRLLMLRQLHRPGWSLPGGLLGRGETAAVALRRELVEEIGLEVEVGLPIATQVVPGVRRVDVLYRIRLQERPAVRLGGEAVSHEWLLPEEVTELDVPTKQILAMLEQATRAGAHDGHLVQ